MKTDRNEDPAHLELVGPRADGWYEVMYGSSHVWVIAEDAEQAIASAEAELRDLGVLPGGTGCCTRVGCGCASSPIAAGGDPGDRPGLEAVER